MKLSAETLEILKNFSAIDMSILIDPGNVISTTAKNRATVACATVSDTFTDLLAIYNLQEFLNIFEMFENPTLEIVKGRQATISENRTIVKYTFAEPAMITRAPKKIDLVNPVTSFELKGEMLKKLLKAVAVMGLPEIFIKGDGEKLLIGGTNCKATSSNIYEVDIGETDEVFSAYFPVERFKQLNRDYVVTLTNRFAQFSAENLTYWISILETSKFN